MRNFAYPRPNDAQAVVNAASSGTVILAGGTELLNWLRLGISSPDTVIDISRLDGLREIEMDGDTLQIGALATLNEIEASVLVREHAPVLSQACLKAASPTPQSCDDRRKHPAKDALPLFPRGSPYAGTYALALQ